MANHTNKDAKGVNKSTIIIATLFLIVIALLICVIVVLLKQKPEAIAAVPNVLVGVSKEEVDKIRQEQEDNSEKNNIIVSMQQDVVFENGESEGRIDVDNVKENNFSFTVEYLLDDGTSVLKTGLLAPGFYLEKQKLSVNLPKGVYPVSAIHTTFDQDGKQVGQVGVAATFTVKN